MNRRSGIASVAAALIALAVIIVVGMIGYYAGSMRQANTLPQLPAITSNPNPNPIPTPTPTQSLSQCAGAPDSLLPTGVSIAQRLPVDFENDGHSEIAFAFTKPIEGSPEPSAGVIVAGCRNATWQVLYTDPHNKDANTMHVDTVNAGATQALVIERGWAGAGTSGEWSIVTSRNGQLVEMPREPVLNQVLAPRGYVFMGYNQITVKDNAIFEIVPGYSKNAPRCCPDLPSLTIRYAWNGTAIQVIDVKQGPLPQQG